MTAARTASTVTPTSRVVSATRWPGTRALTSNPYADAATLNLDESIGQRAATWTFTLINGVSGQILGELTPIRQPATIDHDVTRVIKRSLRMALGVADAAAIDPITDRVLPYMQVGGYAYPLGRYMFSDPTTLTSTGGDRGMVTLMDEMFICDQQLEHGFGITGPADHAVLDLVAGLPLVRVSVEATPYPAVGGWAAGNTRGQVLGSLALLGDFETPW